MSRPDPFALPPATGGRFGLLVLATITSSSYLYSWLAGHLAPIADAGGYCAGQARAMAPRMLPDALAQWYTGCSHWAGFREAIAVAAMLTVLVLGVLAHYLIEPMVTRRGLTPLAQAGSPASAARVREALSAATIGTPVTVFVDESAPRNTRAFGNRLQYSIMIGSADFAGTDGAAVLAHEIGHVRNRDLDATALTTAVWRMFVALAAAPTLLVSFTDLAGLRHFGWRLAVLTAMVYVLRCQVIRTREFYADHRAVGEHRSVTAYMEALARRGGFANAWWDRRFHPARKRRDAVLTDPAPLFRLGATTAAAAGMLVGLAYRPGYHFVSISWPTGVFGKDLFCGVLFGGLAAAVLAGTTWRSAWWAVLTGRPIRVAVAAAAFSAGLLAGDFVAPTQPGADAWAVTALRSPGPGLAVAGVLAAGIWLFLRWTATAAAARVAATPEPTRCYHLGLLVALLVAGVWLGFWFRLADTFGLDPHWRAVVFGLGAAAAQPVPLLVVWLAGLYVVTVLPAVRTGQVSADLRAPWRLVHVVAAGVLAAYVLCLAADHAAIAEAIGRVQTDGTPATLLPVAYLLYTPALVTAMAGGLVAGLSYGSRQRTGQLLAGLVTVLPGLAAGLFLISLAFVAALDRLDRTFRTLVTGLGGLPGAQAADQPRFATLGLMILVLYAALVLAVVPLAWIGARIRRTLRRPAPVEAPLPSRWGIVAALLPAALAGFLVAGLGLREWSVAVTTTDLRLDYDTTAVQRVLDQVRPGSRDAATACRELYVGGTAFPYRPQTDAGAAAQLAALAAIGMSADDLVMQRLGRAAMDAFTLRQLTTGTEAISGLLQYCAAT